MEKTVNDQHLVTLISSLFVQHLYISWGYTVEYARTNASTTNECYNEQFLSIKTGRYDERRCYNERFFMLFYGKLDYSFQ